MRVEKDDNGKKVIIIKKNQEDIVKEEEKKINDYNNKGILLIFNNLSNEYNLYIKHIKRKEDKNKKNENKNEKIIEEEKIEEGSLISLIKNDNKNQYNYINLEEILLLAKNLEKSSFSELLKNKKPNNIIRSMIQDYYLYFITRNESLERETNDLYDLSELLEVICEFQFKFNNKKQLSVKDFLSLIIWTHDYYLVLNELLYCVEYFKLEDIFKKKNIFQEILKKKNNVDIEDNDKEEIIGIKMGMEFILSVLNDKCVEEPVYISKIIEIIPTMYNIEQKYNINSKEIYFLIEIKYIYLLIQKLNIKNYENELRQILKQKLIPCRYLYRINYEREELYNALILSLIQLIKKEDDKKNEKYRYI